MNVKVFQQLVYDYFQNHARQFPWRETIDPYAILVSEVMLQQTQTYRVEPKYQVFLKQFPTIVKLAQAPTSKVLAAWQGLGYNRRALNLQRAAQQIVENNKGKIPDNPEDLAKLPGIGQATASAITAFAFNKPVVFIETNIRRAYIHHFFPNAEKVQDKQLLPLIEKTLDHENPRTWYYALMDYGAALPKETPNPNRRSAHYTKQSTFQGSNRQVRGHVLKYLIAHPSVSLFQLGEGIDQPLERVSPILETLKAEGFLKIEKKIISLK